MINYQFSGHCGLLLCQQLFLIHRLSNFDMLWLMKMNWKMSVTLPLSWPFVLHDRAEPLFPTTSVHSVSPPAKQDQLSLAFRSLRQAVFRLYLIFKAFEKIQPRTSFFAFAFNIAVCSSSCTWKKTELHF